MVDMEYPHQTRYMIVSQTDTMLVLAGGCDDSDCPIYTCADWVIHELHMRGVAYAQKAVYFIDCSEGTVEINHQAGEYESYRWCDSTQTGFLHDLALKHPEYRRHAELSH